MCRVFEILTIWSTGYCSSLEKEEERGKEDQQTKREIWKPKAKWDDVLMLSLIVKESQDV